MRKSFMLTIGYNMHVSPEQYRYWIKVLKHITAENIVARRENEQLRKDLAVRQLQTSVIEQQINRSGTSDQTALHSVQRPLLI
jgi:hypothetical protein